MDKICLIKKVLQPRKKFDKNEIVTLLGMDIEDEVEVSLVEELLDLLKQRKFTRYEQFKKNKKENVQNFDDPNFTDACRVAYRDLYQLLNTNLPQEQESAPTTDGGRMPMTADLREKISPSMQVSSDENKKKNAKDEFFRNVTDVDAIVEDEFLLKSFLISRGVRHYLADEDERNALVNMSKPLANRSAAVYFKTVLNEDGATEPAKKVAKMCELTFNNDGTACEDSRSSSFTQIWNCNIYNVHAIPQFIAQKSGGSIKRSDVVFGKVGVSNNNSGIKDTIDYPSVMEWKNSFTEGADREGAMYALFIQQGISRKRFLVFSVSPGTIEVFGLYWKEEEKLARRVKLATFSSLEDCLKEWLEAILFFVQESKSEKLTPFDPIFEIDAIESEMLTSNVFKVKMANDINYVYKVYDYENQKGIDAAQRRWLNWDLVKKFYPSDGLEKVVDLPTFKIFRYPFQNGGEKFFQHVPPSMKSFRNIGEKLKDLHKMGWIWGDVRLGNMLFISENSYPIDFDFARKENDQHAIYPDGYISDGLPRHPDAKAGNAMEKIHDVYSYWKCFQILCNSGDDCPGSTMEEILCLVVNAEYIRLNPKDIPELTQKTGSPIR